MWYLHEADGRWAVLVSEGCACSRRVPSVYPFTLYPSPAQSPQQCQCVALVSRPTSLMKRCLVITVLTFHSQARWCPGGPEQGDPPFGTGWVYKFPFYYKLFKNQKAWPNTGSVTKGACKSQIFYQQWKTTELFWLGHAKPLVCNIKKQMCVEGVLVGCHLLLDGTTEFASRSGTYSRRQFSFLHFLNMWTTASGVFLFNVVVRFLFPLDPETKLFIGGLTGKKVEVTTCIAQLQSICVIWMDGLGGK